jgi:hypothetical protein
MHEFASRFKELPKNVFATRFSKPFLIIVILKSGQDGRASTAIAEALARKTTSKGDRHEDPNVIATFVSCLEKTEEDDPDLPISMGRDSGCNIVIPHRSISRKHACICEDPESGKFFVIDVGSSYGTELAGKKMEANKEYALKDGSIFVLAESVRCTYLTPTKIYELIQKYRD